MRMLAVVPVLVWVVSYCPFSLAQDHVLDEKASLEFKRIQFPERRPGSDESQVGLVAILGDEQGKVLRGLLDALKERPAIGVEVIGFSDSHECRGAECEALSLRRARCVFDWLREQGIPAARLKGPVGESTGFPLDEGDTEAGRGLNRRVQLEPYPLPATEPGS